MCKRPRQSVDELKTFVRDFGHIRGCTVEVVFSSFWASVRMHTTDTSLSNICYFGQMWLSTKTTAYRFQYICARAKESAPLCWPLHAGPTLFQSVSQLRCCGGFWSTQTLVQLRDLVSFCHLGRTRLGPYCNNSFRLVRVRHAVA